VSRKYLDYSSEGRKCSKCGEYKLWSEYHKSKKEPSGYKSACKSCRNKDKKKYNKKISDSKPEFTHILMNPNGRHCRDCNEFKPLSEYNKSDRHMLNRMYHCKECRNKEMRDRFKDPDIKKRRNELTRKWKQIPENKKRILESSKRYRLKNKEKVKERCAKYRKENPDKVREAQRRYNEKNPHVRKRRKMRRRKTEKQALVSWRNEDKIRQIYKKAKELQKETGVKYHVDHIIPLNHPNVCGLHVEANLQVITASENCAKQNRFDNTYENESWRMEIYAE